MEDRGKPNFGVWLEMPFSHPNCDTRPAIMKTNAAEKKEQH